MTHTPGPWRLSGTEVWAAHHRIVYGGGAYDAKNRNVKRANLLLVAAAPDLLAACKEAETELEAVALAMEANGQTAPDCNRRTISILRAAIDKAENK